MLSIDIKFSEPVFVNIFKKGAWESIPSLGVGQYTTVLFHVPAQPGYIGWPNLFLGIDSLNVYKFGLWTKKLTMSSRNFLKARLFFFCLNQRVWKYRPRGARFVS
jgi:hypothetical protein